MWALRDSSTRLFRVTECSEPAEFPIGASNPDTVKPKTK